MDLLYLRYSLAIIVLSNGICNLYQYLLMRKIWWKMPWSVYSSIIIKVCIMNMRKKKNTYTYNLIKSVLRIRLLDMYVLRKSHLFYISIHTLITWFNLVFTSKLLLHLLMVVVLYSYQKYNWWWLWMNRKIQILTGVLKSAYIYEL